MSSNMSFINYFPFTPTDSECSVDIPFLSQYIEQEFLKQFQMYPE